MNIGYTKGIFTLNVTVITRFNYIILLQAESVRALKAHKTDINKHEDGTVLLIGRMQNSHRQWKNFIQTVN